MSGSPDSFPVESRAPQPDGKYNTVIPQDMSFVIGAQCRQVAVFSCPLGYKHPVGVQLKYRLCASVYALKTSAERNV